MPHLKNAAVILCLLACSLAQGREGPESADFEVLILGTFHAPGMFGGDEYTPAHIRATLELAHPDVVGVECHPTWFAHGRFHESTYEARGVAVPYARERKLVVAGIDWKDIEAWDRQEELSALQAAKPIRNARRAPEAPLLEQFGRLANPGATHLPAPVSWRHMNSEEYGKKRYAGMSPDDENFAARRDREIARNCVELMRDRPGQRLVVVIGAHHKPFLEILLGRQGATVLRPGVEVPFPSDEQVRAAWTSDDLVATLGHRLDAGSRYWHAELVDVPSCRKLLALLEERGDRPEAVRYIRGRLLLMAGDERGAEAEFDSLLADGVEGDVYPFPFREWRMRFMLSESVRIEKARLLLGRGERDAAANLLDPVRKALAFRLRRLEMSRPRELRRLDAVKDWDFESGRLGDWPNAGWWTYLRTGFGRLELHGDEEHVTQGLRSARVDITENPVSGTGRFSLVQAITLPDGVDVDATHYGLDIRGDGIEEVVLSLDPPYKGIFGKYGTLTVPLVKGAWTRAEIALPPPDVRRFAIAIQFRGAKGARLWLDNGTRIRSEYMTIPREWSRLARAELFLKSLLDER